MVDTKEDFMKLDPAEIFSDEMEAAIERWMLILLNRLWQELFWLRRVLEIILGITADGELAITGMNY